MNLYSGSNYKIKLYNIIRVTPVFQPYFQLYQTLALVWRDKGGTPEALVEQLEVFHNLFKGFLYFEEGLCYFEEGLCYFEEGLCYFEEGLCYFVEGLCYFEEVFHNLFKGFLYF